MDYDVLLDLAASLGYRLAMSGAETFRIEESINRILTAYGIQSEVFAIPNSMTISIRTPDGKQTTKMRRIGYHGNDLDAVEKYNSLSRRICNEKPSPVVAMKWLKETDQSRIGYKLPAILLGGFLSAAGFSVFFGGTLVDSLCAGLCGILLCLVDRFLDKFKTNEFFRTIANAFIMAFAAYATGRIGMADNTDAVVIGALMILVPGLLFTNAMRDIIFGDTNSGINRIVQVLLIAAALALGTGSALKLANALWVMPQNPPMIQWGPVVQCVATMIGCIGFSFLFNIHGFGILLCAFGGALSWATYCLAAFLGFSGLMSSFLAALVAACYSEIMARVRKFPAISYLVIAIFPLIPGAGVYFTTNYLVMGDIASFADNGRQTIAVAGVIAVGILMISTIVRLWNEWKQHKR